MERNLLLDFDDGTISAHRNVLTMAVDGHFHFVQGLAVFFFCRESANGCSCTLCCHRLFNSWRKVRPLDLLFLSGGDAREQQTANRKRYEIVGPHGLSLKRGIIAPRCAKATPGFLNTG